MGQETKIVRSIRDAAGTISYLRSAVLPVHFDLLETQEFLNGLPVFSLSLGNLRYDAKSERIFSAFVSSHARLILEGGGIQATVYLHKANEFTVMGTITVSARQW